MLRHPRLCPAQVAQLALPMFLERCRGMLQAHTERLRASESGGAWEDPDDFLCMLEVLQLMQVPPAVADAAIPPGSSLQVSQLLEWRLHSRCAWQAGRSRACPPHPAWLRRGCCQPLRRSNSRAPSLQAIMKLRRASQAVETRERSHLLLLYEPLCGCALSDKPRIRQALQVLLALAGQELGLCSGTVSDGLG